jgi:hypothetical protein
MNRWTTAVTGGRTHASDSGEGMVATHFIASDDVEHSRHFCPDILGGKVVFAKRTRVNGS